MPASFAATPVHAATRRELLLGSGALFAWAFVPKIARAEGRDPRFLTIVLRGALDGLAAVAPVGDPDWVELRGDNALKLGGTKPALPLDGFFALNPAMPNLHRLYRAGQAHCACGGDTLPRALAFRRPGRARKRPRPARTRRYRLAQPRARQLEPEDRGATSARSPHIRGRSGHAAGGAGAGAGVVLGAAAAAAGR